MIWFIPLLFGGSFFIWKTWKLTKENVKEHIQKQERTKIPQDINDLLVEKIEKGGKTRSLNYIKPKKKNKNSIEGLISGNLDKGNFTTFDIGLSTLEEVPKQINYNTKKIPIYIKEQGKDQIILNLMRKYGYTNRIALLETSLERLQEMLWFNERNKQRSNTGYNNGYGEITNFQSEKENIPNEVDWVLEDEESRRIFAGKYYNGEVVSMEEIQAKEIDPELQWELDNQEIVIL